MALANIVSYLVKECMSDSIQTSIKPSLYQWQDHSLSLCHSAICFLGQFMTSFQWWSSCPDVRVPMSRRPMTSFLVIRSQSSRRNSKLMLASPSLYGTSNKNDSLNTGLSVRFFTCVFFLAILWLLYRRYIFTYGSAILKDNNFKQRRTCGTINKEHLLLGFYSFRN